MGCPLEGDKQFLVWPQNDGLKVGGAEFVIDPYSQGALYSTEEVCQLQLLVTCEDLDCILVSCTCIEPPPG